MHRQHAVKIPEKTLATWSRKMLLREWWYLYLVHLKRPMDKTLERINAITAECERREIVKPGLPMPKDGAEDLARDVEAWKERYGTP